MTTGPSDSVEELCELLKEAGLTATLDLSRTNSLETARGYIRALVDRCRTVATQRDEARSLVRRVVGATDDLMLGFELADCLSAVGRWDSEAKR